MTLPSNAGDVGLIPGGGAKIPHALGPKKPEHEQQKQNCNKFNKDFTNGPHKKKTYKKLKDCYKLIFKS